MSNVGFSTKAEKIFWGSLMAYCLTFGLLYLNTQYAFNKLKDEMNTGVLSSIPEEACASMKGCNKAAMSPFLMLNKDTKKYSIRFAVSIKDAKNIDQSIIDKLFDKKRKELPWYINNKLDSIVVTNVNNLTVNKHADIRAGWYIQLINYLGL